MTMSIKQNPLEILNEVCLETLKEYPMLEGFKEYVKLTIYPEDHTFKIEGVGLDDLRKTTTLYVSCSNDQCDHKNVDGLPSSRLVDDVILIAQEKVLRKVKEAVHAENKRLSNKLKLVLKERINEGKEPEYFVGKTFTMISSEDGRPYGFGRVILITKIIDYLYPAEFVGVRLDYDGETVLVECNELELHEMIDDSSDLIAELDKLSGSGNLKVNNYA